MDANINISLSAELIKEEYSILLVDFARLNSLSDVSVWNETCGYMFCANSTLADHHCGSPSPLSIARLVTCQCHECRSVRSFWAIIRKFSLLRPAAKYSGHTMECHLCLHQTKSNSLLRLKYQLTGDFVLRSLKRCDGVHGKQWIFFLVLLH